MRPLHLGYDSKSTYQPTLSAQAFQLTKGLLREERLLVQYLGELQGRRTAVTVSTTNQTQRHNDYEKRRATTNGLALGVRLRGRGGSVTPGYLEYETSKSSTGLRG